MVKYEELKDVIVEAIEECGTYISCDGCKYEYVDRPCHCTSMLIADNILKHYELKEKNNYGN